MNLAVIGTGYVGLVSGTGFAETGNNVICVDIDEKKVETMKEGQIPIYEPGLEVLFLRNIVKKRLSFTTDLKEAVRNSEIIFLCLPTPQGNDGAADLKYVLKVADDIGLMFKQEPGLGFKVIVNKSTVPVGTSDLVRNSIKKHAPGFDFDVCSNPEFLREGIAVEDFMKPERVIIGTSNDKTKKVMEQLYEPFLRTGNPVYFMDEKSAEMTKYAANSFIAMKISFMNEIARLCELTGAQVDAVRLGIGSDSRIGKRYLFPGIGYGGSCFPKDVHALVNTANEKNYDFKILKSVIDVNKEQVKHFFRKILKHYKENLKGKHFAMWGLAFKPNTDDVREAPAQYLIKLLLAAGATVTAYDPEANNTTKAVLGDIINYVETSDETLKGADALIVVTEWKEFRNPDFDLIKKSLNAPVIFDGRNLYDLEKLNEMKFTYYSIGRSDIIN
ncbi:MAG: UDP-glucose/GDP-mannose dehydrogenase family protein [Ignavibacteriota bacterium]|nr:UDP-glucose/GDP-mannose dehydrogenase family protein [Ignavibacteriota bacterium]MCO6446437.1 UDP-glucose/GDP-mannose dehydrogenase family protein [Ignavibacterium album]MCZ2269683.1 UDP-glucose/GDP-mannose dehydrogenase family protein [Ignavibacteriales bacterium]HOJ07370.1 UDP-glucose/GDP-mannose dehydrogenase family protein [Ignavibacteriaceae bacterium]MEB2354803.1 UDP-glucose/GDP-mannose dehydrogenase family protein [Ignavibacteriales bacterium]